MEWMERGRWYFWNHESCHRNLAYSFASFLDMIQSLRGDQRECRAHARTSGKTKSDNEQEHTIHVLPIGSEGLDKRMTTFIFPLVYRLISTKCPRQQQTLNPYPSQAPLNGDQPSPWNDDGEETITGAVRGYVADQDTCDP